MSTLLHQLKQLSLVVADTGDFESIRKYQPRDATTNPSLLLKAAQMPEYSHLLEQALRDTLQGPWTPSQRPQVVMDRLAVAFGTEILKIVSHRVSTEVDARFSFDAQASQEKARLLIGFYEKAGIPRERVLIKVASTWEGICAARELEREGIHCNLTLLFSLTQAVACAEAGVTLISPFVGRILDWHRKAAGRDFAAAEDPGVLSVTTIYNYFKKYGHPTEVMGASFRNIGQIAELAGCDLLTISPVFLDELHKTPGVLSRKLNSAQAAQADLPRLSFDETGFRWNMNEDAMATEKLAEGIRLFAADALKLEQFVAAKLAAR